MRRFILGLWTLAFLTVGLLFVVTMADRPFPSEALQQFSLEVLQRGRGFSREARTASTLHQMISLAVALALAFSGWGTRLMTWLEKAGGKRFWLSLATVVTGVSVVGWVVDLPFAYYLSYYHEKQYGLSGGTTVGWLMDHAVGLGLDLFLGLALWSVLYALIRKWPMRWWAPATVVYMGFTYLLAMLSPILFLPLTGEVTRLDDPVMVGMVERLADRAGVDVEAIYVIKVSDKTTRVNAMVTGLGKTKGIYFYDTLLQRFTTNEVEVVLAHELSHAANHDVLRGWLTACLGFMASLMVVGWALRQSVDRGALALPAPHSPRGLAILSLVLTLCGYVTHPVQNILSRQMEVRADHFAVTVTEKPEAFVTGFQKLAEGNPGDVAPHFLVEFLTHSHPSVVSRMKAAKEALVK